MIFEFDVMSRALAIACLRGQTICRALLDRMDPLAACDSRCTGILSGLPLQRTDRTVESEVRGSLMITQHTAAAAQPNPVRRDRPRERPCRHFRD